MEPLKSLFNEPQNNIKSGAGIIIEDLDYSIPIGEGLLHLDNNIFCQVALATLTNEGQSSLVKLDLGV